MPLSKNEIRNPVTGERIVFHEGMGDPHATRLVFDMYLQPGGGVPVPHQHPAQRETWEIESGTLACTTKAGVREVLPGERVTFEPGVAHELKNISNGVLKARVTAEPPGEFEAFVRNLYGLAQDGKCDEKGNLPFLHVAVFMPEYDIWHGAIPVWVQKTLFALLRPMSLMLGYRGRYERYVEPKSIPKGMRSTNDSS